MELIRKSLPPKLFLLWYLNEEPFPKEWGELPSSKIPTEKREKNIHYYSKEELRTFLFNEQNKKCGYCNQVIKNDKSSPIEHLNPRTHYPKRVFDYFNLILSCDGNVKRETDLHVHCDNLKDEKEIPVFPTNKKCEKHFVYDEFGNIFSQSAEGKKVIEVLGLNCAFLKNKREEILFDFVYNSKLKKKTSEEYKQSYFEIISNENLEFKNQILCVLFHFMNDKDREQCKYLVKKIEFKKWLKLLGMLIIKYLPFKELDIKIKNKQKQIIYSN